MLERENERLRREVGNLQDLMNSQMVAKDNEIGQLYEKLDRNSNQEELQSMLRKENEAFRHENRLLRDQVGQLTLELDSAADRHRDDAHRQQRGLEGEIGSLRAQLQDRERENIRLRD